MAMFENVLVGIDGSENGRDAIALASRLAQPEGRLTLAHVETGSLRALAPGALSAAHDASVQLLEQERGAAGRSAEIASIGCASAGRGLHEQAEAQAADLLVVGSSRRGVFSRVMLGDDTRGALNGAPCAVAVAARGYAGAPTSIARIGVGYDESEESEAALAMARVLAENAGASIHVLEVVSFPSYALTGVATPTLGVNIDDLLTEARARVQSLAGVEGSAAYGLAGEELAAFAAELDILIVGSRSYGPLRRLVLGSTSDFLARHARSSLLVLPRVAGVER
jgi:nucleotide-binding universal stress UspA family protein